MVGQLSVVSSDYKVFRNFVNRLVVLTNLSNGHLWQVKMIFAAVKSGNSQMTWAPLLTMVIVRSLYGHSLIQQILTFYIRAPKGI